MGGTSGGLFNQQPQQTGLGGVGAAGSGGIFGGQTKVGGGLFGGTTPATSLGGGGMFGGQAQAGGGIFGGGTSGGLFSQPNTGGTGLGGTQVYTLYG